MLSCHVVVVVNGVCCCPIDPMVKGVEGKRVVVVVTQGCPRLGGHSGRVVPVEKLLLLLLLVKVVSAIEVVVDG